MSLRSNNPFDTMSVWDIATFMARLDRYDVEFMGRQQSREDGNEDSELDMHQDVAHVYPPTLSGDVDLVVCILLTDHTSWEIWDQWAAGTPGIGFVSHPTPGQSDIPYSVDNPIPTQWGTSSLIFAELLLYQTATVRFPAARHFMLVSGDTVPIHSAGVVLQYYTRFPSSTHFLDFSRWTSSRIQKVSGTAPPTLHPYQRCSGRRPKKMQYHSADQFKTICRRHVDYLLSEPGHTEVTMLSECTFRSPGRIFDASLDEIVIPTILICQFGVSRINNTLFMKVECEPSVPHPITIRTMSVFRAFWSREQERTPDCHAMRKIHKSIPGDVLVFLRAEGVLPPVHLATPLSVCP